MPKASNTTQDKKSKPSSAEEKDGKKSISKPKSDQSQNKLVENEGKVSGKNDNNGRRSISKGEEGEKQKSRSKSKKMILKAPEKPAESKNKQKKEKSPSLKTKTSKRSSSKEPASSTVKSKSHSRPKSIKMKLTSLGKKNQIKKKKENKEEDIEEKEEQEVVDSSQDISLEKSNDKKKKEKDRKSKSKSKAKKERSRTKSMKRDKSLSKSSPTKPKEDTNTPSKTGSSPTSKVSGSSSRSVRYKEISTGKVPRNFTMHTGKKKSQPTKMKGLQSISSESHPQGKKISARNVKESSSNIESSSSIDLSAEQKKRQSEYNFGPDSQRISQEVEEVIKRIEDKKRQKKTPKLLGKKKSREEGGNALNHTSKDFDYILQKNPNSKKKAFINLEDLSKHPLITYSDILLALLEVGQNSNSYLFAYSSKSRCFWSDILQYNVLKKIFSDFKAETLRKYWSELSKYDTDDATDLIKKNKSYLDKLPIKLGTIVSSISKLLSGKIKDLKEYIDNIQVDIRKREIFEHEFKNPETGEVTKIKEVRTTYNQRKRYEPGNIKDFIGSSINIISLKEVYHQNGSLNDFQKVMSNMKKEDTVKFTYLNEKVEEEKRKINSINEEDKFIFKAIDNVLDALTSEFKNYTSDFILETLQQNSMDIGKTYACLKEPMKNKNIGFTALDDKVLLRKQGEEYKILVKEKGKEAIQDREEFLNN